MIIKVLLITLVLAFSFLQATILPANLLLLLVILVALYQADFSFLFAFLSGLILDMTTGASLGVSSIKFLLVVLVICLLQNRLPFRQKRQLKLPAI